MTRNDCFDDLCNVCSKRQIRRRLVITRVKKIAKEGDHGRGALLAQLKFALAVLTRDGVCGDPSWHTVARVSPLPSRLGAAVKNNEVSIISHSCTPCCCRISNRRHT